MTVAGEGICAQAVLELNGKHRYSLHAAGGNSFTFVIPAPIPERDPGAYGSGVTFQASYQAHGHYGQLTSQAVIVRLQYRVYVPPFSG